MTSEELNEVRQKLKEVNKQRNELTKQRDELEQILIDEKSKVKKIKAEEIIGKCFRIKKYNKCESYDNLLAFKVIDVVSYGNNNADYKNNCICLFSGFEPYIKRRWLWLFSNDMMTLMNADSTKTIEKFEEISEEDFNELVDEHMKKVLGEEK